MIIILFHDSAGAAKLEDLVGFCGDIFREFLAECPVKYRLYKNKDGLWGKCLLKVDIKMRWGREKCTFSSMFYKIIVFHEQNFRIIQQIGGQVGRDGR